MYTKARILFVGNSFTARNTLSNLLAQLVEAGGKGVLEWKLVSAGGALLRQHFKKGGVATLLRDLDTLIGQVSTFRKGEV